MTQKVTTFQSDSPEEVYNAYDDYLRKCVMILEHIFHKADESSNIRHSLKDMEGNRQELLDLMHDEPILTVARFLGIDPLSAQYEDYRRRQKEAFPSV